MDASITDAQGTVWARGKTGTWTRLRLGPEDALRLVYARLLHLNEKVERMVTTRRGSTGHLRIIALERAALARRGRRLIEELQP